MLGAERSLAGAGGCIGFVGLGAMGGPMARRLVALGHEVLVYDLNPVALQAVTATGARGSVSLPEVAEAASLVFTCLPSLQALREVLDGPQGLRGAALRTVVDCSTTGSAFALAMAQALAQRGVMLLDAPITGSVVTAGNGQLGIMCSGPRAAFEQAEPVMRDLAGAVLLYLGEDSGQAQRLKLLNNLLSATGMAASCEAFVLGVKWGLDPEVMLRVINAGEASSSATRNKFPTAILPRRFGYGARMAITAKDTALTIEEAEALGVPMWIGQAVRQLWHYAASHGGAELDGTTLITFLEAWAGVEVRGGPGPVQMQAERPADGGSMRQPMVLLCAQDDAHAVRARLQAQAWTLAETSAASGANARRHVRIVPVSPEAPASEVLDRVWPDRKGLVVNLCPMPTGVSAELSRALAEHEGVYLDAALADAAWRTGRSDAMLLVAGPGAVVQEAQPLLQAFSTQVLHMSPRPGGAHLLQQIEGSLASTLLAVTCEAFVVGARSGLTPESMTRIMGVETGRNAASARILPQEVATRRFAHGKRMADACRELDQLSQEAARLGLSPWVLDKARLLYRLAAQLGRPEDDISRLALHYEAWAGTAVRATPPEPGLT